ncbi:hypothetical protein KKF34_15440 [Myxococcota bacterium]|nr:hypothetical protein [Myxococcota bacterium]MBU1498270.1 hypothetical protein [Myxococcota bacterium]
MGQTCEQLHADYPTWPSGVYTIDPNGDGSGSDIYEVYCNMDVDGGGWTRVVRTTGQGHDWGQNNASIVDTWAGAEDIDGVYDAFDLRKGFNQVMILKTSGNTEVGNYASFNLVSGVSSRSIMDILTQDCQPATEYPGNDTVHDGARVARPVSVNPAGAWTSEYSGLVTAGSNLTLMNTSGTLVPVSHFFMCGVNESSDNDQSVLAFSDSTGSSNTWDDSWRYDFQAGTIWSFWNGDYHVPEAYHIGKSYGNAFAGYKNYGSSTAHHSGTYEIYVRGCDFLTADGRCVNDEVFTVSDYSTNNCISVDHEATSGDDRGGIAANSSYFLYNGDSNMMRTDTSLGSRTALTRRDGVFSDLRSGQFYILWNTATSGPIDHNISQYTIDSVATYDPVTEAVGTPVPFGQSITFAGSFMNGVYAGYGFAILYNDADHNWYILHPEFGSLTLLNNAPRSPNLQGCENFATWGVATFDGTNYKVDAISGAPAVERYNVSTGTVEGPVNSFTNLGQMCAFTMVPGLNKWVGHHEYSSQIGGGAEVMFSCDVTWSN